MKDDPLIKVAGKILMKSSNIALGVLSGNIGTIIDNSLDLACLALGVKPPETENQKIMKKLDDIQEKVDKIQTKLENVEKSLVQISIDIKLNYFLNQINPTIAKIGSLFN